MRPVAVRGLYLSRDWGIEQLWLERGIEAAHSHSCEQNAKHRSDLGVSTAPRMFSGSEVVENEDRAGHTVLARRLDRNV